MPETATAISPSRSNVSATSNRPNVTKNINLTNKEKFLLLFKKPNSNILPEDMEILTALQLLKEDLDYVHNCLNHITDPVLIDSYIYQIQSINMRYQFYLQLCKDRGLMADIV